INGDVVARASSALQNASGPAIFSADTRYVSGKLPGLGDKIGMMTAPPLSSEPAEASTEPSAETVKSSSPAWNTFPDERSLSLKYDTVSPILPNVTASKTVVANTENEKILERFVRNFFLETKRTGRTANAPSVERWRAYIKLLVVFISLIRLVLLFSCALYRRLHGKCASTRLK